MELFTNPLKEVPHRKGIAKAVQHGWAVEISADASLAVTYALRLARLYGWLCIGFSVLGILDIIIGASTSEWVNVVGGIAFVGDSFFYGWVRSRALRSVSLNQGIA